MVYLLVTSVIGFGDIELKNTIINEFPTLDDINSDDTDLDKDKKAILFHNGVCFYYESGANYCLVDMEFRNREDSYYNTNYIMVKELIRDKKLNELGL